MQSNSVAGDQVSPVVANINEMISKPGDTGDFPTLAEVKFRYFALVWKNQGGCHQNVATVMGVSLKTVYNLIKQYGADKLDPSSSKRKRPCSKAPLLSETS